MHMYILLAMYLHIISDNEMCSKSLTVKEISKQ